MSKYDFEIDLSTNTSTGIILNKINHNSKVLEFGCATGRMTKYMKEELGCDVYIVEYDQDAFDVASEYAVDGVCGDAMNYEWYNKFSDYSFDVIMFADMLEHVSNPSGILKKARELLSDKGYIYVSVPNVTHNDILYKEMNGQFDYTKTGLLDDTHIHFWGKQNLPEFAKQCNLYITSLEATYSKFGYTEQYQGFVPNIDPVLYNYLHEREDGEIYQFVFALSKNDESYVENLRTPHIESSIYFDYGEGFSADSQVFFYSKYVGKGIYQTDYLVENIGDAIELRYDPVELQGCIVKDITFVQDEEVLPYIHNGSETKVGVLFSADDPLIVATLNDSRKPVKVEATILLANQEYIDTISQNYGEVSREYASYKNSKDEEIARFVIKYDELTNLFHDSVLAHEMEKEQMLALIMKKDAVIASRDMKIIELGGTIDSLNQQIVTLNQQIATYRHMLPIRIRRFFGRVLRGVKRRVKNCLSKGNA